MSDETEDELNAEIIALEAVVAGLRSHLKRVRKAIGDINGARAQDEAALDSLALDLDEYLDEAEVAL